MNEIQTTENVNSLSPALPYHDIVEDDAFSYEGYQVVRGEFFAHIFEPSFTFNSYKVSVNTACIKKLPDIDYVQILVNPEEKKLAVKPCPEEAKDSFRWCSANSKKRSPKQITCRIFFAKVIALMGWNPNYRYKLLGKLLKSGDDILFVFDLNTPEIYKRAEKEGEKPKMSRTPSYPADWQNQFGLPVEEHQNTIQVNMFNGYTVFGVQKSVEVANKPLSADEEPSEGKEEMKYEQQTIFETNSIR